MLRPKKMSNPNNSTTAIAGTPRPNVTAQMHFCPIDQNLLHITNNPNMMTSNGDYFNDDYEYMAEGGARLYRWYCLTCNYTYPIDEPVRIQVPLQPKEVDSIMGGEEAWQFAPVENEVTCEECEKKGAYFRQMQTRSADEPMTLFFKCKHCGHQWSQG